MRISSLLEHILRDIFKWLPSSLNSGGEREGRLFQSLSTSRGSCFWWGASVQVAERLLEVQHFHVGHSSQGTVSQDPAPPPPKRPAQTQPPPVSNKKPKQILSPRAEVWVTRVKAFSPGNLPKNGKKAVEQMGRDVHDVLTLVCMKAPGLPPLLSRIGPFSRENSQQAIRFSGGGGGGWAEIWVDPWAMRIVQWGYMIPFVQGRPINHPPSTPSCIARASLWRRLGQSSGPYFRASG